MANELWRRDLAGVRSEGQPRSIPSPGPPPGDARSLAAPACTSPMPSDLELLEPDIAGRLLRSLVTVRASREARREPMGAVPIAWLQGAGAASALPTGASLTALAGRRPALIVLMRGAVSVGLHLGGRRVVTEILTARAVLETSSPGDVVALAPTEVVVLSAEALRKLVTRHPATALAVAASLQARIDAGAADRAAAARLGTLQRVARILLRLGDRHGRPVSEGLAIDLPLTQQDLADLACASAKATATALQRLRSEGAVRTARRQVVLFDGEALARIAALDGRFEN